MWFLEPTLLDPESIFTWRYRGDLGNQLVFAYKVKDGRDWQKNLSSDDDYGMRPRPRFTNGKISIPNHKTFAPKTIMFKLTFWDAFFTLAKRIAGQMPKGRKVHFPPKP